ncbi:MAG: histidine phosphatase family protein [Eubacteriales bacterium]|nr:histidine phosphatase family protein [Eubacteriales bacterium]MDD4104300.1 histidine phosphatase family protein [Eubacteriales bacterium]MDD4709753.1 histidine phosphatase family protein [Eubacteriales bacterium]
MKEQVFRITLLRHGETAANEQGLYCGVTDVPLSPKGIEGILSLKRLGTYAPLGKAVRYSSDMRRTNETLQWILGEGPQERAADLREMSFGLFEMRSYEQLKNLPAYQAWITDRTGLLACPGGESDRQFRQRIYAAFDNIMRNEQDALIVCHGGVIARLMAHHFPDDARQYYDWQPRAGQGYTISFSKNTALTYTPLPLQHFFERTR